MIKHIVMWTLKEQVEGASAEDNARTMKTMLEGSVSYTHLTLPTKRIV